MSKKGFVNLFLSTLILVAFSSASQAEPWKPSWSPDGKYIVYYERANGNMLIKRLELSTNKVESLTDDSVWLHTPKYSSDGKKIFASGKQNQKRGMFEFDIANKKLRKLEGIEGMAMHPAQSPDGKWLAYDQKMTNDTMDLHLMNLETGEIEHALSTKEEEYHPMWSPDSRYILLDYGTRESSAPLVRFDTQTKQVKKLVDSPKLTIVNPAYSNSGKNIVFGAKEAGIIRVDAQGKHKQVIRKAPDGWKSYSPVYSPNDDLIAFTEVNSDFSDGKIMLMKADGSDVRVLVD